MNVDLILGISGIVILALLYITSLAWDSICDDLEQKQHQN